MAVSRNRLKILKDIVGDRKVETIRGRDLAKPNRAFLKNGYFFNYPRPKTQKNLEYFDPNPIIVIIGRQGRGRVLGLNLNHIPYAIALQIAKKLEKKAKGKKRALRYEEVRRVIKAAKLPEVYYMVALRSYLLDRISGPVYVINIADGEYYKALKDIPRKTRKMGLGAAMKMNQKKVRAYIKAMKKKGK